MLAVITLPLLLLLSALLVVAVVVLHHGWGRGGWENDTVVGGPTCHWLQVVVAVTDMLVVAAIALLSSCACLGWSCCTMVAAIAR